VIESGKARRRAILLALLTTFVALFPPAFEIVGEEPYLAPMATSMFWGTLLSTLLALSSVPCLYLIAEDIRGRFLPTPGDTK
jgi:multidrug efflux pump subunit AcrB